MTQLEWQHLESLIGAMTPQDRQRLAVMLAGPTPNSLEDLLHRARQRELEYRRKIAAGEEQIAALHGDSSKPGSAGPSGNDDPIIGCMADESDLLDEIMEGVYHDRENLPFRAAE
jgi:hypothetical protein